MCDPPVSRAVSSDANDRDAGDAECAVGIGGDSDAAAAEAAAAAGLEPCVPLTPAELHSRGCGLVRLLEESSGGTGSPQAQQGVAAQRWVDADSAVRARALCELRVLAWAAPGAHRMDKLDVRPGAGANHPGYPEEHCFFLVFVERLGGDAAYGRTILLRDVCARVVRFCAAVRLFCTLLAAAHGAGCGILSDCTASKRRAARLAEKAAADMKKKEQKEGEEAAAADSRKEEEEGRASVSEGAQAESREEGSARTADGERGGGETSGDRRQPPCPGPHPLLYPVEQPLLVSSVYRVLDGVLHPQHLLVTDRRLVLRPTLSLEDLSAHGGGCGGPSSLEHLPLVNCNEAAVEIPATLISSLRLFQEKRDVAAAAATRVYARHRRQQQQQALLLRTKKKGSARSSPLSPRSSAPNLQDDGSSGGEEEEEEAAQTPHSLLLDEELLTASKRSEYLEVTCKNTWQVVLCFREPRDGYAAFSRLRKRPKGGEEGGGATRVKAVAAARPVVAPRPAPVAAASNVPAVLQRPPSLLSDAGSENPLLSASASPAAEPEAAAAAAKKAAATEPAAEYYLPRRLHPSPAAVPGRFSVARTTAGVLNAFLPKAYAQDSFFALAYARKLFFPLLRAAEVAAEAERFHVEELRRIVRGYEARNAAGRWRISEANKGFVLCKTMPEAVLVPAEFGDADVRELAGFRVGARFPMVSWVNPVTGACIVRASQPAVGIRNRRCSLDERLMASLCAGVPDGPKLSAAVMDARPFQNAVANLAKGGGYVSSRHYNGCSMVCANIGNIHTMRRSLDQLRKVLSQRSAGDKNWIKQVEDSEWSAHIERILQASLDVACMAGHGHKSVLVHCTNGWDRTSQLVAVANLLLDPHYRTLKGFLAVLDKDWLCGSHKFAERLGLGGNEKYRAKGISPVFLQFVEGVVQLVRKSPNAYEFNERFLLFLCVAPWSGKIGSFMVNTPKVMIISVHPPLPLPNPASSTTPTGPRVDGPADGDGGGIRVARPPRARRCVDGGGSVGVPLRAQRGGPGACGHRGGGGELREPRVPRGSCGARQLQGPRRQGRVLGRLSLRRRGRPARAAARRQRRRRHPRRRRRRAGPRAVHGHVAQQLLVRLQPAVVHALFERALRVDGVAARRRQEPVRRRRWPADRCGGGRVAGVDDVRHAVAPRVRLAARRAHHLVSAVPSAVHAHGETAPLQAVWLRLLLWLCAEGTPLLLLLHHLPRTVGQRIQHHHTTPHHTTQRASTGRTCDTCFKQDLTA